MKQLILDYVQQLGIKAVLRNITVDGPIKIKQIDFYGIDDKYHSIAVGYNSTRIFSVQGTNLLGELNNDALQCLEQNHRVFDSQKDWLSGRYATIDKKTYALYCKTLKAVKRDIEYNDFKLDRIEIVLDPIFAYIIAYSFKGVVQKSLILVADQLTDCSNLFKDNHDDFMNFISLCGFRDNVTTSY